MCPGQTGPVRVSCCLGGKRQQRLCWGSTLPAFEAPFSFSKSCRRSPAVHPRPLPLLFRQHLRLGGSFLLLPHTKPQQTLRSAAGNHLRKALWTGPRWKLGSALHPLPARRLLTHRLRTIINTPGGRRVFTLSAARITENKLCLFCVRGLVKNAPSLVFGM